MVKIVGVTSAIEKNVNKLDYIYQIEAIKNKFKSIAES